MDAPPECWAKSSRWNLAQYSLHEWMADSAGRPTLGLKARAACRAPSRGWHSAHEYVAGSGQGASRAVGRYPLDS